ncbi:PQQ-dependent sugar dehydrogenase [Cerasicoccus arenae]|nr:PQQ-dependent sugar dehydrogenase [Cerasicoccus arenae]MBK1858905.1 PQQ-dependent sugar dehydrogenase [Cerasicoccus arenae]
MNRLLLVFILSSGCCLGAPKVEELYAQHCQVCHGEKLEGGLGASLIDGEWRSDGSIRTLMDILRNGQPEFGMPGFAGQLSESEMRALVIYIQEREKYALEQPPKPEPGTKNVYSVAGERFRLEKVASGLATPWSVAFLPEGRFLVTEKLGGLRIIEANGKFGEPIKRTPAVFNKGQGGLLEVALHPDYAKNGWVYLAFSDADGDVSMTKIVRGKISGNNWVEQETIFEAPKKFYTNRGHHFGCRIAFDDKGYLFFSIGERGQQEQAQDTIRPNGKIHRIHDDGRIPSDNPFVENGFLTIWSYGNRNPQGLDFHPETGVLWESEHGPRGGDELNVIQRGANYGWPIVTYGMNYNGTPITSETSRPGMEQPIHYWTPSIAVCGIDFYEGDAFPSWKNRLLVGSLRQQELHLITLDGESVVRDEIILEDRGRVRDVASGPDGAIYLVLNSPDELARLVSQPKD